MREHAPKARTSDHSGWRLVVLVAVTYVYFLIFAQFGFLKRLDELGITAAHLKPVMGAMALGGIVGSLFSQRLVSRWSAPARMRACLLACSAVALCTVLPLGTITAGAVAMGIGLALGALTVTLVTDLRTWTGAWHPLWTIAAGTGCGYFLCNVPWLFNGTPRVIAITAAVVCAAGALLTAMPVRETSAHQTPAAGTELQGGRALPPFAVVLACFMALIWLDSAAFFIIQNSPDLKAGTWRGAAHLWRTGMVHLLAALLSAWLLQWRGLAFTLACAYLSLAAACLFLLHPEHAAAAAYLYPTGVSLYSVALVVAPSFLLVSSSRKDRARKAGWIYAIAGWIGSAMGIGMGQNLHRVPPAFVLFAGIVLALPLVWNRARGNAVTVGAVVLSLGVAYAVQHLLHPPVTSTQATTGTRDAHAAEIARGRQVYIAEGCIHCHSQYVRPHSADVEMWGPTQDVEVIRREKPPLIGNRRQGPDLSEVGSRRSALWMRIHFMNPRNVSYRSIMPSYAYLFQNRETGSSRGDALIAYLASLKTPGSEAHLRQEIAAWTPAVPPARSSAVADAPALFQHDCATCHSEEGIARRKWHSSFVRLPPVFGRDCPARVDVHARGGEQRLQIARMIKFGIPGTDMPGHEYLPDTQIDALSSEVAEKIASGCGAAPR